MRKRKNFGLACGFGRHAIELAKKGFSVVGVDITTEYIKEARRISSLKSIKGDVPLLTLCESS
ncbi:class I SAM-dependent methyltransferase [Sporomusa malonica]|uniref:class I SAM-dependent methyltransferase n=1 Tax=Sporomusa malonica TaxID=112901 RepID=UPI00111C7BBA